MARALVLARHNFALLRREPGPAISRLVLPLAVVTLLRPLYLAADPVGGTGRAVAGCLTLFSLLAMSLVGTSILVERSWHTADRLRASPARPVELLAGKAVPILTVLMIQQTLLILYGVSALGLRVGRPDLLCLTVLVWTVTLLCLGTLIAALVPGPAHLSAAVDITTMLLGGLGGALVPASALPGWAQAIAPASPGFWALRALTGAIEGDSARTLAALGVLAAAAAASATLATARLAQLR